MATGTVTASNGGASDDTVLQRVDLATRAVRPLGGTFAGWVPLALANELIATAGTR